MVVIGEWADQILKRAGIPYDGPAGRYTIPKGFPPTGNEEGGTLLNLIESRGFPKRSLEWYAGKIRIHLDFTKILTGDETAIVCGRRRNHTELWTELERLIHKAQILLDPNSAKVRPGGKVRGAQIKVGLAKIHAEIREAAAKKRPGISKRSKAKILKKEKKFRHLSEETIRKLI